MLKKTCVTGLLVALFMLLAAVEPLARGRRRGRAAFRPVARVAFVRGYRPRYYGGFGYGGFGFYPATVRGYGHYGSVDFNVFPKESQVFVDGALIGRAGDYNGGFLGHTAKLTPGTHDIIVVAPDGKEVKRKIYVMPGRELNFNYRF